MASRFPLLIAIIIVLLGITNGVDSIDQEDKELKTDKSRALAEKDDLKTDASSGYGSDRYSSWNQYPSGYGGAVSGYGSLDDRYYSGSGGYGGYSSNAGYGGYSSNAGYGGYNGGASYGGYGFNSGYDGDSRYGGYGTSSYGGYQPGYSGSYNGYGGNGGYGGYSGNGGLNSYYGYNPSYQGGNHLGYGYYNKRPGYGSIYSSGITPSQVTGFRGYSKK